VLSVRRFLLITCFTSMAVLARAQTPASVPAYRARVLGVYDANTGDPIDGVRVTAVGSGTWAATTKTGTVSLAFLPDGGDSVTIRKAGYKPTGQFIEISPTDTAAVTVILTPTEVVLPAVVTKDTAPHYISPGLQAFEERRKTGFGQFIPESEMRKSDNRQMVDVLRRLHGINFICSSRVPFICRAFPLTNTKLEGPKCPLTLYVDGVRYADDNLMNLQVNQFAAVEAYIGARAPAQYNATSSGCGVLLFWTRER